jgi:hypothetical protein
LPLQTKQLVTDLKTLRKLAEFLLRYDAVTFLKYLDTLRMSEGIRSVWLFAEPTHKIFEYAKRRVYQPVKTGPEGQAGPPGQKRGPVASRNGGAAKKRKGSAGGPVAAQGPRKDGGMGENGSRAGASGTVPQNPEGVPTPVELEVVLEEMPKWRILRVRIFGHCLLSCPKLQLLSSTRGESTTLLLPLSADLVRLALLRPPAELQFEVQGLSSFAERNFRRRLPPFEQSTLVLLGVWLIEATRSRAGSSVEDLWIVSGTCEKSIRLRAGYQSLSMFNVGKLLNAR